MSDPVIRLDADEREDRRTRRVEMAWIEPLRKYAPAILVLCIAILLAMALALPSGSMRAALSSLTSRMLLLLVYVAFAALAAFLFIEARQREEVSLRELADTEELHGLSERLSTTLDSIGEGVVATDVDGLVTLMNRVAAQLTGWPIAKAVGMPVRDVLRIVNESNREPIEDPLRRALARGHRVREDTAAILLSRSSKEYPIAFHASPILDSDGWIVGAVLVFQDVTSLRAVQKHREQLINELSLANERLRDEVAKREEGRRAALNLMQDAQIAQAALRESEERLRVLFEGIDDALFVHDADGRMMDCNPAACEILGYAREDLLRLNIRDLKRQHGDAAAQWLVKRAGDLIPVHVHTSVIHYGETEASLIVARDIAELKKIQDELRASNEQLRESNAALEEYARVASHDLQEPLRKIESFAQVLREDCADKLDARARGYIDIMAASAARMRRLIRDVLAFSRAGTAEKPFGAVDLTKVMAIVQDNLSERIQERRALVVVHDLPTIHGDETQMIQLFQNLVGNGLKFNEGSDPRVEVFASENDTAWTVCVRDNGIGMRPGEAETIFAPFKRLHNQQRFEGTGIGLAICRRIVTRHGGTIGVESELNKGSTFWFTLPKATHRGRGDAPEAATPPGKE